MMNSKRNMQGIRVAAMSLAFAVAAGFAPAQTAGAATDQDKDFLKNTAQDSNFEIKTGQLALQKSQSADVKQYATMVIHDHTQLKQQIRTADTAAKVQAESPTSMSVSDDAEYLKLKVLSGKSFDESYIKGLLKGNAESVQKTKDEAAKSGVPAVKRLAEHRDQLDTKHTEKAKQLAEAHNVQVQS